MGVKERLKEFIASQKISNREFCRAIGVSESFVNSIRKSMQPDKLKAICDKYPELNPVWLMTGDGQMMNNSSTNVVASDHSTAVAGNGNKVTTNDISGLIELQKGYQNMIREKDTQISRLISVIEKLSAK